MGKEEKSYGELGSKYGKPDLERLGIFSEMPYMNGKGYVSSFPKPKLDKGKTLLAGYPKVKCGLQDCYIDKEFKRLFVGEALKGRGKKEKPSPFKNVSERPIIPTGDTKWHSTPGDWHGTFQGHVEAFSNKRRPVPPYKSEGPNLMTSPGKKGGYGYLNICINPYPTHSVEKYGVKSKYKQYGQILNGPMITAMHPMEYFEANPYKNPENLKPGPTYVRPKEKEIPPLPPGKFVPTGPAKWLGGCKAGCFDKYPQYSPEKYKSAYEALKPKKYTGEKFCTASSGEKTLYTCSVINENLRFRVNQNNCYSYEPSFIKHLM